MGSRGRQMARHHDLYAGAVMTALGLEDDPREELMPEATTVLR